MDECGPYPGWNDSWPADCNESSALEQHGDKSPLPQSDGKVLQTAGGARRPPLCVDSLAPTGEHVNIVTWMTEVKYKAELLNVNRI